MYVYTVYIYTILCVKDVQDSVFTYILEDILKYLQNSIYIL